LYKLAPLFFPLASTFGTSGAFGGSGASTFGTLGAFGGSGASTFGTSGAFGGSGASTFGTSGAFGGSGAFAASSNSNLCLHQTREVGREYD